MTDDGFRLNLPSIFFGDALVNKTAGDTDHPCRTAEQANAERLTLCEALFHAHAKPKASRGLATRLIACEPAERCYSGACPCCVRAHQSWLKWATPPALELLDNDGIDGFRFVTIVPTRHAEPGIETMTGCPTNALRRVLDGLRVAGISAALGAIDLSFDEAVDASGTWVRRRCAHAHLLVPAKESKQWTDRLRGFFPSTPHVRRPVRVEPWDGNPKAIGYGLRPNLSRRVSIPADGSGERANTRIRPLRVDQRVEAALVLDRFGLTSRIVHPGFTIENELEPPAFRLA